MRIHKYKRLKQLGYPVGERIKSNLPTIKIMGSIIKKYYNTKGVNLWCMGSSGAILAAIVSQQLDTCKIIHVKKQGEVSHTNISYIITDGYNIIIDDFIATGNTVNNIVVEASNYGVGMFDALICSSDTSRKKLNTFPVNDVYLQNAY